MSIDAIGGRIAAIESKMQALLGTPAPTGASFDKALATASTATSPTASAAAVMPTAAVAPLTRAAGVGTGVTPYAAEINAAAARHGLDPALLSALIRQESGFNPHARSAAGASGLTQLMPGTAAGLGVTDPTDPAQAIEGGAKYLKQQLDRFGGDPEKALAAYNAGPGAVQRYGGVPPYAETQNYVRKVMAYAEAYRAQGVAPAPSAAAPATSAITGAATATASTASLAASALAATSANPALTSPLATTAPPAASTAVASSPSQFGIV